MIKSDVQRVLVVQVKLGVWPGWWEGRSNEAMLGLLWGISVFLFVSMWSGVSG